MKFPNDCEYILRNTFYLVNIAFDKTVIINILKIKMILICVILKKLLDLPGKMFIPTKDYIVSAYLNVPNLFSSLVPLPGPHRHFSLLNS